MSSRGTTTSSLMQRYCCFTRDPHALCSRLNEIARLASVAEYSFTGIETSPNETLSDAMDLAAMVLSRRRGAYYERKTPVESSGPGQDFAFSRTFSRLCFRVRACAQRSPVFARRSAAL